jgi:hypothetical protein
MSLPVFLFYRLLVTAGFKVLSDKGAPLLYMAMVAHVKSIDDQIWIEKMT